MRAIINFHAFHANFEEQGVGGSLPTWAIWLMRDAFETTQQGDKLNTLVLAAAQYILWSGQTMFRYVLYSQNIEKEDLRSWGPGPSYQGTAAIDLPRWQFWKQGFRDIASREVREGELGNECNDVSRRAAEIMDVLERNISF